MKRLFTLLLISFAALSCEMIDEKLDDLLGKKGVVVFAEGTELTANVSSKQTVLNYKFESTLDWEVKTESEWLEVDPMSGKAGKDIKIQIKVAKNKDKEGRTGYADLTLSNDESYRITINQAGEGDENEDVVVEIPNNQIWYTSIDGEIVEPYSGEENNFADALTTFGVNILSNTYVDGKGVIEFDGDVTTIGECAFAFCSSLTSVTIPDSVTTIGYGAFAVCSSLTSVTIPDSVTAIGYAAFGNCSSLTSVTIGNNVTTIGYQAFHSCSKLTSVTIPDSVTTIDDYAFWFCTSLTSVTIGDGVTTIGDGVFYGCGSLQEFNGKFASEDGRCLIIDGTLNYFAPAGLTEYTIPDSVTTIGVYAFRGCSRLTSITIPDSVTSIGEWAFYDCSSLDVVHITDLSAWCRIDFTDTYSNPLCLAYNLYLNSELVTDLTIPADITVIKDYAFFSGNSIHNINLHNGITSVGFGAFVGCSIQSVTIPDSITEIKDAAFTQCPYLTEFRGKFATEDGLALIVDGTFHAFANGSGITEYTIPDGVATIGASAFNKAYSLESVTIPDSVTAIGAYAFNHCINLIDTYCKSIIPPYIKVQGLYKGCNIYVPAESYQDYISADGWGDYAAKIRPYDYENSCVIEANASDETKRWLGKWSSTVSRTYCPQTGFNEETLTFEVNIEHNAVSPHFVKVYGLSVIDPTIAVDGIVNANGDLEILNYCYVGNSGNWNLYMWALSESGFLTYDRHAVYTMSMDECGNVSCEVGSNNSSPYIMFDIFGYNTANGSVSWYDSSLSYYSGPMSWVKVADSGATASRYSQKVPYITNFQPQADTRLKVVE